MKYETIRDLLDAKSVWWKYYSPSVEDGTGRLGMPSTRSKPCATGPNGE